MIQRHTILQRISMSKNIINVLAIIIIIIVTFNSTALGADLSTHFKKAQTLYKDGYLKEAIVEYRIVADLLIKSKNFEAAQKVISNIGTLQFKLGQHAEAITSFKKALSIYRKPEANFAFKLQSNLASALYSQGDYQNCIYVLQDILKTLKPTQSQIIHINLRLGDSLRRSELYASACEHYRKALNHSSINQIDKSSGSVSNSLGLCLSKLGRYDEAIKNFNQAINIANVSEEPQTLIEAYSNLAIAYWEISEYAKALNHVEKAIALARKTKLQRNLGADYNNRGLILKSAGHYAQALESVEQALSIAKSINNPLDQAIALGNRALIYRITGRFSEAQIDYTTSLSLYAKVHFKEGLASSHLGLGKVFEVYRKNYPTALDHYQKALSIYKELENPAYQAEALNQVGRIFKKGINPKRISRDLLFENEAPKFLNISPDNALQQSQISFKEALNLGIKTGKKEVIWSARQGLAFALKEKGELKNSLEQYKAAIDTVMNIYGGKNDSELMGDYLKDKEELFTEAMEVASTLAKTHNNPHFIETLLNFQEIYKNEVIKNAAQTASLNFEDNHKKDDFKQLQELLARKSSLERTRSILSSRITTKINKSCKTNPQLQQEEKKLDVLLINTDQALNKLIQEWKNKYPTDSAIFDSSSQINIKKIQNTLLKHQALLQYFPLSDSLSILCITKETVSLANIPITYKDLAKIIRDDFIWEQIELFGHQKSSRSEKDDLVRCHEILEHLHSLLIKPIQKTIKDKTHLLVVPSKYLSYLPYSALVTDIKDKISPRYLLHDKTISYVRLSYLKHVFDQPESDQQLSSNIKILALGNPQHKELEVALPPLPGTESEIAQLSQTVKTYNMGTPTILLNKQATEDAWRDRVAKTNYQVFYFATHGVPFAELLQDRRKISRALDKWSNLINDPTLVDEKKNQLKNKRTNYKRFIDFCEKSFPTKSPLLGFLYMSYTGTEQHDGVLTLREILEMPESSFVGARIAVLSACNTAVTYSPKVTAALRNEIENEEINQELLNSGWTPGVDQICLADTFMRRKFTSVLGTLWFADDQAVGFIVSHFFKNIATMTPAEALRKAQLAYLANPPLEQDYTAVPRHPFFWSVPAVFGR